MKQKTLVYVCIALLAVTLLLIVGRQLVIVPLQDKIVNQTFQGESLKTQLATVQAQVDKIRKDETDSPQSTHLLPVGSEHQILQTIVSAASATGFLVEAVAMRPSFHRKQSADEPATPAPIKPGELPPVDDQGNAIGAASDDGDSAPSVEVVPVRVQGRGSVRSWGLFLRHMRQELPLFGFRDLHLHYTSSEPKGWFEVVVPLKSAAQAGLPQPQAHSGGK